MRHSLVVYFLFLSLLLSQAQGIRLEKWFKSVMHQEEEKRTTTSLIKTTNGGVGEVILCKEGQCTGKNRKLITATTSTSTTTTTTSKNEKNGEDKANSKSKGKSDTREIGGEQENLITANSLPPTEGIADLDYSPPKTEPPIHT